jgi:hypothetical protein
MNEADPVAFPMGFDPVIFIERQGTREQGNEETREQRLLCSGLLVWPEDFLLQCVLLCILKSDFLRIRE